MNFKELKYLVRSDSYRYDGGIGLNSIIKKLLIQPTFKYSFWMRMGAYFHSHRIFRFFLYPVARLMLFRYQYKCGITIHFTTKIASGFYIGHFGGIVVSPLARIGKNCNISHGVTIGYANRGKRKGAPVIGDNVYLGPGAKVVGNVKIGNNVAVGANCVVTKDVENNAVVVGIPGKIISYEGSVGYINRTDYDDFLNTKHSV